MSLREMPCPYGTSSNEEAGRGWFVWPVQSWQAAPAVWLERVSRIRLCPRTA